MYLCTVQLGIQNPRSGWSSVVVACMRHLSWHPLFLRMGFDAFSCCTAVLSLASARKHSSINKCLCKIPAVFAKQVPGVFLQPS